MVWNGETQRGNIETCASDGSKLVLWFQNSLVLNFFGVSKAVLGGFMNSCSATLGIR